MAGFEDLISNPEFGRNYRGSSHFRTLFRQYWEKSLDDEVSSLRGKLKIDVDERGQVIFTSKELGYTWNQKKGETPSEMMKRIQYGDSTDIFDPTHKFGLDGVRTSERISGPQNQGGRVELGDIARRHRVDIHLRTFNPGQENFERARAIVDSGNGDEMMGVLLGGTDKHRLVEMYTKSGRKLNYSEVLEKLGMKPDDDRLSKRLRAVLNANQASVGFEPGEMNVFGLDVNNLFPTGSITRDRAFDMARKEQAFNANINIADRAQEIMLAEIDGINYQTTTANKRMMDKLRAEVDVMQKEHDKTSSLLTPAQRLKEQKKIDKLRDGIDDVAGRVKRGEAFNMRAFGQSKQGEALYVKGDVAVINPRQAMDLVNRSRGRGKPLSMQEVKALDLIMSESKADAGVLGGRAGRMTMSSVSSVGQVHSDFLSIANLGELYNPTYADGESLLSNSLRDTVAKSTKLIQEGDISDLRAIADQIETFTEQMFDDPQDYLDAIKNKDFIQRIDDFVSTGGKLESSPEMTREAMRIIGEHNFNERRHGKMINFAGEEVKDYRLRIPVPNSVHAHGEAIGVLDINPYVSAAKAADISVSQSIVANPGMSIVVPDFMGGSRFKFSSADIRTRIYAAAGGPDFDDLFNVNYMYDPEARRTLALMSRSPNALTEYSHLDVDLALSPEYQERFTKAYSDQGGKISIRGREMNLQQLNMRQKELNLRLEKYDAGKKTFGRTKVKQDQLIYSTIEERDEINEALHGFFSSEASGLRQAKLSEAYAFDPAIGMRKTYASAGHRTTDASLADYAAGSSFRGYGVGSGAVEQRWARDRSHLARLRNNDVFMPSEYIGEEFNEIFHRAGGGASRLYIDASKLSAFEDIKNTAATGISVAERGRAVSQANGLLGRSVNAATVMEQFVESTIRSGALSPDKVQQFIALVESNGKFNRIQREKIIDEIEKTGDPRYIAMFTDILEGDLQKLGRVLGGMKGLGIDPAVIGQRLNSSEDITLVHKGYQEALGRTTTVEEMIEAITLSPNDLRSGNMGKLYQSVIGQAEDHATTMTDTIMGATQNLLNDISDSGFQATEVESEHARKFLGQFVSDQRDMLGPLNDPEKIQEILESGLLESVGHSDVSELFGEFTEEELHRRSMSRFNEWGLLDDRPGLDRQLVAIRQMAAQRDLEAGQLISSPALAQTSMFNKGASINRLTHDALNSQVYDKPIRDAVYDLLDQTHAADGFQPERFIRYGIDEMMESNGMTMSSPSALGRLKSEVLATMEYGGHDVSALSARFAQSIGLSGPGHTANSVYNAVHRPVSELADAVPNPGSVNYAMRSVADAAAEAVNGPMAQTVQRAVNMDEISRLMSKPGFRAGLGAAAIFAGLGILHQVRGERTPQKMQGPMLSPDSNAYSGVSNPSRMQLPVGPTSYGGGQGMTYSVRGSGSFDPYDMASQLELVTGASTSGTIYQGSNLHGMNSPRSSSDALNSYLGR